MSNELTPSDKKDLQDIHNKMMGEKRVLISDEDLDKEADEIVNDGIWGYPQDATGQWAFNLCKEYFLAGAKFILSKLDSTTLNS